MLQSKGFCVENGLILHFRLVPPSNPRKSTISRHIRETTVSTTVNIIDTHQLNLNGGEILHGRNTSNQAFWQMEGGQLRLFVSAKSSSAFPLIHLAEYLLDICGIENPLHVRLLHILLTEPNDDEIEAAFVKGGLHVEVPKMSHREHTFEHHGINPYKS